MMIFTHNAEENLLEFLCREERDSCAGWQAILLGSPYAKSIDEWKKEKMEQLTAAPVHNERHNRLMQMIKSLRQHLGTLPCKHSIEIFFCTDNDIVIIGKNLLEQLPASAAASLYFSLYAEEASAEKSLQCFDLVKDYPLFSECFNQKMIVYALDRIQQAGLGNTETAMAHLLGETAPQMVHLARQQRHWEKPMMVVADNDRMIRRKVQAIFGEKFNISHVVDGQGLLSFYLNNAPDLVLACTKLKDMNGMELSSRLTQMDPHAFMLLTDDMVYPSSIVKSIESGARGLLLKPFSRNCIERYMKLFWEHWDVMRKKKWERLTYMPEQLEPVFCQSGKLPHAANNN